jgi:hypothetical protein
MKKKRLNIYIKSHYMTNVSAIPKKKVFFIINIHIQINIHLIFLKVWGTDVWKKKIFFLKHQLQTEKVFITLQTSKDIYTLYISK